jgi:hypothetical protein
MPISVRAFTSANLDGTYTIFVNTLYEYESQYKAVLHEVQHIYKKDMYSEKDADLLEYLMTKRDNDVDLDIVDINEFVV